MIIKKLRVLKIVNSRRGKAIAPKALWCFNSKKTNHKLPVTNH